MLLLEVSYAVVRFLIIEKCGPQRHYGVEDAPARDVFAVFVIAQFGMREEVAVGVKSAWIMTMHLICEARAS